MKGWMETWRGMVAPWECDLTEHFTIAYYFDRLADAASAIGASLGLTEAPRSAKRRFDVRFVRELRAGASFHILSAPIALDEGHVRLGHQIVDSADGAVTAWVEETLAIPAAQLPRDARDAINRRLLPWPGPVVEQRPEPSTIQGFIVTVRDRVKPLISIRTEISPWQRLSTASPPPACKGWRRLARRRLICMPSDEAIRHSSWP
jgi:acyl-CoA thioesterase FadM